MDASLLSRRWHFHGGVFQGRGGVCVKIIRSRYPQGTRSMQATSVFVCIHGAACVHSGNCARGTTVVDESSNPCQHRSCRCPRWVQWKLNFPPSSAHRNLCFLRNPFPSSHHSWGTGLSSRVKLWVKVVLNDYFLFWSWDGLGGVMLQSLRAEILNNIYVNIL